MRCEDLAEILKAKRVGPGKWIALCPGHADRKPSLHIAQGSKGILLKCFSHGCTPAQITDAMGLHMGDLFNEKPASPELAADLARQRQVAVVLERGLRLRDREKRLDLFRLERLRDALGGKLARRTDDPELSRLFHATCDRIAETTPGIWPEPEDGPLRAPGPRTIPVQIHAQLSELGQTFNEQDKGRLAAA